MGTLHTNCTITSIADRTRPEPVQRLLVDAGSAPTWVPEKVLERVGVSREKKDLTFVMANGEKITRSVGFAIIRVDDAFTVDEVVFAEEGDLLLLGARTLEGMNLTVDAAHKTGGGRAAAGCGAQSTLGN